MRDCELCDATVGGCPLRVQGLVGTGLVDSPDGGR